MIHLLQESVLAEGVRYFAAFVPEAVPASRDDIQADLKKLDGSWVLVRTRGRYSSAAPDRTWLLIKHRDEAASTDDVTETQPRSVISKRVLAQIALDEGGDVVKAASGDPESEIRELLKKPLVPRRRGRKPSVWHSKVVS